MANCERCGREIKHKGRCLPCNYFYKHGKYYNGLVESPDYDHAHGVDPSYTKKIIKEHKIIAKKTESEISKDNSSETHIQEKTCILCNKKFKTRKDYEICYKCFKFFYQYGGIENYRQFLDAFNLKDNSESKNKYIGFMDKKNRFLKVKGNWTVDNILANPEKFLDKIKPGRRKKK